MKHLLAFILLASLLLPCVALADEPLKLTVLCVGDSITYGTCCPSPLHESYPARLSQMDGPLELETINCGVPGATICAANDYTLTDKYHLSISTEPDVVLVMLGTNDSNGDIWQPDFFDKRYEELIIRYQNLPGKPTVFVLLPMTRFNWPDTIDRLQKEIIPREAAIAQKLNCPIIDMNAFTADKEEYFPDKLHPNRAGYALTAEYLYEQLKAYYIQ